MTTQLSSVKPKLATILLAAGESARFGGRKQLARSNGKPMIAHALDALISPSTPATGTFVVLGAFADEIAPVIERDVTILINDDWASGMGSSIACGMNAISNTGPYDGVLIALCDQIHLTPGDYAALIAKFDGTNIVASQHADGFGVPAIFPATMFAELAALSGQIGARKIINRRPSDVTGVALPNAMIDIDTKDDLKQLDRQPA
jgi:molybdenum cofactor cytidylyltransferase